MQYKTLDKSFMRGNVISLETIEEQTSLQKSFKLKIK